MCLSTKEALFITLFIYINFKTNYYSEIIGFENSMDILHGPEGDAYCYLEICYNYHQLIAQEDEHQYADGVTGLCKPRESDKS